MNQSSLWSHIHSSPAQLSHFDEWVAHAGNQPLHVTIKSTAVNPVPQWLRTARRRFQSLSLTLLDGEDNFLKALTDWDPDPNGRTLEALDTLSLEADAYAAAVSLSPMAVDLSAYTLPSLHTLSLTRLTLAHLGTSLGQTLKHLRVSDVEMGRTAWERLLHDCTSLTTLSLHDVHTPDFDSLAGKSPMWDMPTLTSLEMVGCDVGTVYHILRHLHAPNLQTLSITVPMEDVDTEMLDREISRFSEEDESDEEDAEMANIAPAHHLEDYHQVFPQFRSFVSLLC